MPPFPHSAEATQVVIESTSADAPGWMALNGCTIEATARYSIPTPKTVNPAIAVQASCPRDALPRLPGAPGLVRVRAPLYASAKSDDQGDATTSEGYAQTMARDWHADGVTGKHVTVGILDVGYSGWEELQGTELPSDVATDFTLGSADSSAHGTAVAEIVHDFAPDASLILASFTTDVEFASALRALVDAGANVVNGSVGFDNVWPADGTSLMSQAVDAARDAGVIYVAAAGNENDKYAIGPLTAGVGNVALLNRRWGQRVALGGNLASVRLRWDEAFGAAAVDLDLALHDANGVCGQSANPQDGDGDPVESVSTMDCLGDEAGQVYAVVTRRHPQQEVGGLIAWMYGSYGVDEFDRAGANNLTLPADADGAFSVGAWDADGAVPAWSSRGPTDDGRAKPDLVGPSGVTTASQAGDLFSGTSASAAHASGLAALWLDATHRWGEPEAFRVWAAEQAIDVTPAGVDLASGAGGLHADELPERVGCGCSTRPGVAPTLVAIVGPLAWLVRRRARHYNVRMRPGRAAFHPMLLLLLAGCADRAPYGFIVIVTGRVVDNDGVGIGGATVTLGSSPIGNPEFEEVAVSQADPDGNWTLPFFGTELVGGELRALYDAPGRTQAWARYVLNLRSPSIAALDPGPVQTWESTSRRLPTMELADEAATAHGEGVVVSILGEHITGATVEMRRGWNAASKDPVGAAATTDSTGAFSFDGAPGWWTATVQPGATWGESRFGVFLRSGETESTVGVVPSVPPPWLSAALTWSSPTDLDLHLMAPQKGTNGATEYHVWSGDPRHPENDVAEAEAELVRADSDPNGPESLVVQSAPDTGEIRLSALDNTDIDDPNATQLGLGQAQLNVWIEGQEPTFYTGSPGEVATLWRPVEVEGGVQYQVETYSIGAQPTDDEAF